ncbi:MAG: type II toxin-antitoxin system HicA family toxin [Thermoguttaceae bacterium]|nr:type II toxin-antitoxin system HicA family toxin [Thermoguttaceae bacterium]
MNYRELIKELKKLGWTFDRQGNGSHEFYVNPDFNYVIVVANHGCKEIPTGTAKRILKDARGEGRQK